MKTVYAVTLSIIAGFGLGILAGQLRAQTAPPAYVITLFDSGLRSASDTDYPSLNPATFQPYGGHYITHFGKTVSFDGRPPNRSVIIAFDSMEKAQACIHRTPSGNHTMLENSPTSALSPSREQFHRIRYFRGQMRVDRIAQTNSLLRHRGAERWMPTISGGIRSGQTDATG